MKIFKLFMINIRAEIFTNSQKTREALTRPRKAEANAEPKATGTTTNGKSSY